MKKILLIGTGGTIASMPTENGLAPEFDSNELLNMVPEIKNICSVDCVQPISMDSTNIRPGHWIKIGEVIKANYGKYDGFVVTHGTDTMAYSSSALSYIIQNSEKPIVLTGAQVPLGMTNSDAGRNLIDAFIYACDKNSHGVVVVFSGSVISGTRARKNYSKRFDAFSSVNFPEVARIQGGRITRFINEPYIGKTEFFDYINPCVGLIKLVPGTSKDLISYYLDKYDGVVIESFGVGGIPEYSDFYGEIQKALENGKTVVMTTQVPNEGSDISVYEVGNILKKTSHVLEAYDMTGEAVLTKLMWALGQTSDREKIKELFYKPVAHDILRFDED